MAWEILIGDIPILKSYYNFSVTGNDIIQTQPTSINPVSELGAGVTRGFNLISRLGIVGDIDLFHIRLKGTTIQTPDTELVYYTHYVNANVLDVYLRANSQLGTPFGDTRIRAAEIYDPKPPKYIFGVALYGDAMGADLQGVCLFGAVPTTDPNRYNNLPAFAAPFCLVNIRRLRELGYEATQEETSTNFGPASTPDGYKPHEQDHTSDTVGIPDKPSISVTTAGFYHAYKVTQGLLQDFGAKLFPSLGAIVGNITGISDTTDVLKQLLTLLVSPVLYQDIQIVGQTRSFIDMILNGKAIDYVVDCHIIPVSPTIGGSDYIKCGVQTLDISAPVITEDYIDFDCGSISIPENFQNYLDYHGTRAKLFLVGVGFVDIKPEFWNGGTLNVKYRFNILDGSFMCYVSSTSGKSQLANTVIGQYGGCMCLHIPVTGLNYASMISGLVTGSMSLAGNLASGNAVGAAGSALSVANTKPSLAQSNNYNSSTAFLGVRRPYLQIERQVPSFSTRYNIENGLPLNVSKSLGSVTGFTVVENPQLNLTCDDDEREEIYRLLQSGVIF